MLNLQLHKTSETYEVTVIDTEQHPSERLMTVELIDNIVIVKDDIEYKLSDLIKSIL